jgi:hypothetical protein
MKDIVRLEAASAATPNAAHLFSHAAMHKPMQQASGQGARERQDRISISPAAHALVEEGRVVHQPVSAYKLASLQDRMLADSLNIDLEGIADRLLQDVSDM